MTTAKRGKTPPPAAAAGSVDTTRAAEDAEVRRIRRGRPMFLDSHVDVVRDGEVVRIQGGVLVEDTDLSEDEIDELTAHRAIRLATDPEIERADRMAAAATVRSKGRKTRAEEE
jgi:hypothetical protein